MNERIRDLDARMLAYDRRIEALARESATAQRLIAVPGIGPVTATALVATVGQPPSSRMDGSSPPGWV